MRVSVIVMAEIRVRVRVMGWDDARVRVRVRVMVSRASPTIAWSLAASCADPRLRPHVLLGRALRSGAGGAQHEGVPSLHPHSSKGGAVSTQLDRWRGSDHR